MKLDLRIDWRFRLDVQLAQQILPIQFSQTTALLWAKQNCSLETNFAVPIFNVIVHDFMTMSHTTAPTHSQTNAMMINMVFVEQRGQIFSESFEVFEQKFC